MVFGAAPTDAAAQAEWACGGIPIQRVEEYKYLGVLFSAKLGLAATFKRLRGCLNGAWVKLQKQFGVLHNGVSLALMRAMFQQGIPPAGSYACELWGVRRLSGPCKMERKRLGQTHVQLWRRLLRLPKSVHREIVLRELAVRSPQAVWLRSACRFWNALSAAPEGSLQRAVALSDWDDAISRNVKNWAWSLHHELSALGYALHIDRRRMFPLDIPAVLELHDARAGQCWENCDVSPRTCATQGAALCKYHRWFALPDDAPFNPFFRLPLSLAQVYRVVRFRLGCHRLPIWAHAVPRAQRVCLLCDQHALGDEYHMLFECTATQAARAPYAHLFPPGCTMLAFMRHDDTMAVVRCILACLHASGA